MNTKNFNADLGFEELEDRLEMVQAASADTKRCGVVDTK